MKISICWHPQLVVNVSLFHDMVMVWTLEVAGSLIPEQHLMLDHRSCADIIPDESVPDLNSFLSLWLASYLLSLLAQSCLDFYHKMLLLSLLPYCWFLGLSTALAVPSNQIDSEISIRNVAKTKIRGEECINSPTCRNCWDGDFSIGTDSEEEWPNTGKTVKYVFEVTEKLMAPDGTPRDMIVVNGQYPGPTIVASEFDSTRLGK